MFESEFLFNDMSTLVGHFMSSSREREKGSKTARRRSGRDIQRRICGKANDSAEME